MDDNLEPVSCGASLNLAGDSGLISSAVTMTEASQEDSMVETVGPRPNDRSTPASSSLGRRTTHDDSAAVPENDDSTEHDHNDDHMPWKGWAELENDPLIFTKLLKDWGVSDVKVEEVIPLDTILEKPADKVLGLIFLSRWTAPDDDDTPCEPPSHLWFANQISTFSCATLALMNIINNAQEIELGTQVEEFKESTSLMNPKDRGKALDEFHFVRDIHNSFSRDLDRKIVDLKLKEDYQAANKRRNAKKKKKGRRKRTKDLYDDEDNGFHFVAYVASRGEVWKLDGMEALPRLLGTYRGDENWLMATIDDIQRQLEGPEVNDMEFSLLSLTREAGMILDPADEMRVERMKEDWSPFFAHILKLHAERGDLDMLLSP